MWWSSLHHSLGRGRGGYQLRVEEIDGVVHVFYGEQLVRALVIDESRYNQPLGKRSLPRSTKPRSKPTKA